MLDHRDTQRSHKRSGQPQQRKQHRSSHQERRPTRTATHQFLMPQDVSTFQTAENDVLMSDEYADDLQHYLELSENEKQGSVDIDTDTTSFQNVSTADGTSSYVMVHNRTYSNGSNQTSGEGSEARCYSTPSQASCEREWTDAADSAVDTEAMEEDTMQYMPHDLKGILPDMYSPEPRAVYNPYQQATVSSSYGEVKYQEKLENYSIQSASPQSTYALSPSSSHSNGFEAPWNHIGDPYRVPRSSPGFAAFAPSPGPAGEHYPEDIRHGVLEPSHSSQASKSVAPAKRPRTSGKTSKGKEKADPGWEHTVIRKDGLTFISEVSSSDSSQDKYGRRKGKLDAKAAAKARKIRKLGACWDCWVMKVPCSEGTVCERCRKRFASSPSADQLCCRSGFKDYEEAFFPEFLHSHFEKKKIEGLINEHATGWTDKTIKVDVLTGADFKPMRLAVNVFIPRTAELLNLHQLTTEEEERASLLVCRYSAPVGLMCVSPSDLKKACREHIETMIETKEYPSQATAGDLSPIPYLILEVIRQYCAAKEDVHLVRSAKMLHAIHYFMSRILTFTEESANKVYQNVQPFGGPQEPYLSSRLLSRQVKYAMHKLHREITTEVLEGLEKSMRTRTRDSWGPSFCAILVLCLCIEGLQTAADTFIVCDWEKCEREGVESQYCRNQSAEACQALDDYPFQQCTRLFHDIYRSHKEGNGGERKEGFNPLRALRDEDATKGLDQATDQMVRSIYSIIYHQYTELLALSKRPALVNLPYVVESNDIKANNTGRLAAKFLISFFPS